MEAPPFGMTLLISGVILAAAFSVYYVVALAAEGKLGHNGSAGIRLSPLLRSEEAWQAGHTAALTVAKRQCVVVAILAALTVLVSPYPWLYIAGLSACLAVILISTVLCVVRAVRAANSVGSAAGLSLEP